MRVRIRDVDLVRLDGAESGFSVFATLTGLQEGTTYHFRIVASNTLGTSHGTDETFKTRRKRKG